MSVDAALRAIGMWLRRVREIPAHREYIKQESNRQDEEQRVNAIEDAAVSRKQRPGVFHSGSALQRRLDQVAKLRGNVHAYREKRHEPKWGRDKTSRQVAKRRVKHLALYLQKM